MRLGTIAKLRSTSPRRERLTRPWDEEAAVTGDAVRKKRLIGLFLLGYMFLNNPLLSLFNRPVTVWGIPLLFGYIFGVWLLLIVLVLLIVRSGFSSP